MYLNYPFPKLLKKGQSLSSIFNSPQRPTFFFLQFYMFIVITKLMMINIFLILPDLWCSACRREMSRYIGHLLFSLLLTRFYSLVLSCTPSCHMPLIFSDCFSCTKPSISISLFFLFAIVCKMWLMSIQAVKQTFWSSKPKVENVESETIVSFIGFSTTIMWVRYPGLLPQSLLPFWVTWNDCTVVCSLYRSNYRIMSQS